MFGKSGYILGRHMLCRLAVVVSVTLCGTRPSPTMQVPVRRNEPEAQEAPFRVLAAGSKCLRVANVLSGQVPQALTGRRTFTFGEGPIEA